MNVATVQQSLNNTIQVIELHLEYLVGYLVQYSIFVRQQFAQLTKNCSFPINFTPLQWTLLKVLLTLLIGTLVFTLYSWRVYGRVISEKFVRPSTLKEIEELKLSVAKLKLPKEHSPRI